MKNTVKEFSDLFSLISRLIDNISGATLRALTAVVIIGRLLVKPVEIAIGILRDFEARREERRLKKAKRNESAKGSSSSFFFIAKESA